MAEKRLIIIFIISVTFLLVIPAVSAQSDPAQIDLSNSNLSENIVKLDGTWEFYWERLLQPGEFERQQFELVKIPAAWNGYKLKGRTLPSSGYATYRLILNLEEAKQYGLKIPRIFTAYKLWVNRELLASAGNTAENEAETAPQYLPQTVFFEGEAKTELVVQVANFSHRSGGILESIRISDKNNILTLNNKSLAYDIFLFGSIFIMGIYHLILYLKRKKEYSLLYFGLFCVLVSFRTILVGEIFFIQLLNNFSWETAHKIKTLSFYLGVLVITRFFYEVFSSFFNDKLFKIFSLAITPFILIVLITPARIFTLINPVFQILTLIIIFYMIYVFYKVLKIDIIKKNNMSSLYIIIGALVLFLTVFNDIAFLSVLRADHSFFNSIFFVGNLSSLGFLVFIFADSLALAVKYSNTFVENKKLSLELIKLNENLESKIKERTKELFKSNIKIKEQKKDLEKANETLENLANKDALTMIWNRRYFDQILNIEWRRALRRKKEISLLFIDIDDFKLFNDYFGHKAGDKCLIKIAESLKSSAKRAGEVVARYGGEEFVVLLPDLDKKDLARMANQLRKNVEELTIKTVNNKFVTVSIGAARILPEAGIQPSDLINAADEAMYSAKDVGKNQVKLDLSYN